MLIVRQNPLWSLTGYHKGEKWEGPLAISASTLWANGYQGLDVTNCPPVTSEGQIAVVSSCMHRTLTTQWFDLINIRVRVLQFNDIQLTFVMVLYFVSTFRMVAQ